jgi:hypothetical protein
MDQYRTALTPNYFSPPALLVAMDIRGRPLRDRVFNALFVLELLGDVFDRRIREWQAS